MPTVHYQDEYHPMPVPVVHDDEWDHILYGHDSTEDVMDETPYEHHESLIHGEDQAFWMTGQRSKSYNPLRERQLFDKSPGHWKAPIHVAGRDERDRYVVVDEDTGEVYERGAAADGGHGTYHALDHHYDR